MKPLAGRDRPYEIVELTGIAVAVRQALAGGSYGSFGLRNFPIGSCGDASRLLGRYLEQLGLGEWEYVMGLEPGFDGGTHAWLEQDGLIVDVTADQFADVSTPVIVTFETHWHHRRFPPARRSTMYMPPDDHLLTDYGRMLDRLPPGLSRREGIVDHRSAS